LQFRSGDEALRRLAERLRLIHEVHRALGESIEIDELLELILARVFDHLRPEQGAIFLKKEEECLAACCGAPMMMVNHVYHENLTLEQVDAILDGLD